MTRLYLIYPIEFYRVTNPGTLPDLLFAGWFIDQFNTFFFSFKLYTFSKNCRLTY